MVSGGNMANLVCFWAARAAKAGWDVRQEGSGGDGHPRLRVYASVETHTWIQKATDLSGLGTAAIRWIPTDADQRLDVDALRRTLYEDVAAGDRPLLVVGTAGNVSTGAVDPLPAIAAVCREHGAWFHVDGAYGGFAAAVPDSPASRSPTRSPSIRTSGCTRRSRPAARWSAIRRRCVPRSRITRPTSTSTRW
jgi:aromatic-L-amino-acid decarboxylase